MKKSYLFLLLLMTFLTQVGLAQKKTINGSVSDESGLALPGASVIEVGTNNGVTTDFDGNFTILVQENAELNISFVGFKSQTLSVGSDTNINVQLIADNLLEEIIVTGYSSQRKSEVTGSAVQLDEDEITQMTLPTVDQALQGKVAGLNISTNSGTPGSTSQIRIRGISSITAGNEPLYVIDGVPVTNGNVSDSSARSFFSALSGLDNNNIKSITVLKDASSTAQYGARGANGVILITTKKGKVGKTSFNFNSYYGVQNDAIEGPVMLTAAQRLELYAVGLFNDSPEDYSSLTDATNYIIDNVASYKSWDEAGRPEAMWADVITNEDAPIQEYSFSASGGDEKNTFFASLGYMDQEATVIGSKFSRTSSTLNVSKNLSDKVIFSSNNAFTFSKQDGILERSAYFEGPRTVKFFGSPLLEPFDENGEINQYGGAIPNPLYLAKNNISESKFTRIISNNSVNVKLFEGFSFGSTFNIDNQIFYAKVFSDRNYGYGQSNSGELVDAHRNNTTIVFQNFLDYNWNINENHQLDFKLLQEYQQNKSNYLFAEGHNFSDDGLYYLNSAGSPIAVGSSFSDWYVGAYMLATHYSGFNGKYVADLTLRREGNSRFNSDNRWGNFGSMGIAWNLHKEAFLLESSIVNNLKLRVSYGVTGNANIPLNQYQSLFGYDSDYAGEGAAYASTFGNNKLSWETSNTVDFAVDFGLFDSMLSGSLGYYKRESNDLLLDVPLSLTTGFDDQTRNVGSLENKGIELEIDFNVVQRNDFNLSFGGNIASNQNQVTALAKDGNGKYITIQTSTRKVDVGQPVYGWYMPTWAGVNPENGEEEFYINGKDGETTTVFNDAKQEWQGGGAVPTLTAGINIHIDYKGFFIDASGYFAGGHKVYEGWHRYINNNYSGFSVQYYNGFATLLTDAWRQAGDQTRNGKITAATIPWQRHSKYLYDGDFARLRVFSIGYDFPKNIVEKINLDKLRVFARGDNLLTWKKSKNQPYDPEVDFGRAATANTSIDPGGQTGLETPPVKSLIIGLNLKF